MRWLSAACLCASLVLAAGGRLLLAVMPQGRSHAGSAVALARALQSHGHSLDFYMEAYPDEMDFGMNKRFIHIDNHSYPFASDEYEEFQWNHDFVIQSQMYPFFYGSDSCDIVLRERRTEFDAIASDSYDLVLTDSLFSTCGYAIATLNKGGHLIVHSTNMETSVGSMRAHASNNALLPRSFMPLMDANLKPEQFYYRMTGAIEWLTTILQNVHLVGFRMSTSLHQILPHFSFSHYIASASLQLTDMPSDIFVPFPRANDLIEYGSYCSKPKALTSEWEEFVSDVSSKGTILVAFGTVINWRAAPHWKFQAIRDTLNSLTEYRIVWAYNGDPIQMESHVRMSRWVPQLDILQHNRTVLFFSHGGLKSVKEATCSSTPSLFMPMFAEQIRNAFLAKHHGFGEIASKHELSLEYLREKMLGIVRNRRYQEAANKVRSFFLDKVVPPVEVGAHRVDQLVGYGGRMPEFFYPRAISFGWIKYLNLDLFIFAPLFSVYLLSK